MDNFSERLLSERKRLGLNQEGFGALAGVSKITQLNYEKGLRKPDSDYLEALVRSGVDVNFLLTGLRSFNANAAVHEEPAPDLSGRLKQERKRLGLTVGQLAEKAGLDRVALLKWEDGEYVPDANALLKLYAAGVDVPFVLLSLKTDSPNQPTLVVDELELLLHYRAAPDEHTKSAARRVVGALVEPFLPAENSKN